MITVALVDGDPMVRIGLGFILKGEDDIDVAWQADDGTEVPTKLRDRSIDVVLLDVQVPGLDGFTTLEELRDWQTRPRVIVLTTFDIDNYVVRTLKLRTDIFLLKGADPARLVEAIQRVATDENVLAPDVTCTLITVATGAPAVEDPSVRVLVATLTECGCEIVALMTQGLTNNQIGTRLHLSPASVKSHLTSLFVKLDVDSRVFAATIIHDAGL